MDIDEEVEAGLVRQFSCLGTTDKEVLTYEFQKLVGVHSNEQAIAAFYLGMTDWNLQAAVCAYFDFQSAHKLPQMTFMKDITIGEGESVPPDTRFIKTWRIKNSGVEPWPPDCRLVFTGGHPLGAPEHVQIMTRLSPSLECDVSVEMTSPSAPGLYSSKWRMSTISGMFFGDAIWVIIQVDSGGTLALMQQMMNLKELGSETSNAVSVDNPFAVSHQVFSTSPSFAAQGDGTHLDLSRPRNTSNENTNNLDGDSSMS